MNDEQFQQRVAGTPLRPLPPEWRESILQAASAVGAGGQVGRDSGDRPGRWSWAQWWERVPAPWVALASAWGVVLMLHGAVFDDAVAGGPVRRANGSVPGAGGWAAARAYQAEVLALVNAEVPEEDEGQNAPKGRPAPSPRPRTQWSPPRGESRAVASGWMV